MTTIRNRGTAGDALNGTNNGLVKAVGPGVYSGDDGEVSAVTFNVTFPASASKVLVRWHQKVVLPTAGTARLPVAVGGDSSSAMAIVIYQQATESTTDDMRPAIGWSDADGNRDAASTFGNPGSWPDGDTWVELEIDATGATQATETFRTAPNESGPWTEAAQDTVNRSGFSMPTVGEINIGGFGSSASNRWAGFLSDVSVYFDDVLFWRMPEEIDESDPGVTVNRATTGPVTTLVPAGKTVLINPDPTDGDLALITPTNTAAYTIAANEDAVVFGVLASGNPPQTNSTPFKIGASSQAQSMNLYFYDSGLAQGRVADGVSGALGAGDFTVPDPFKPLAYFVVLDRSANQLSALAYDESGLVESRDSGPLPALGAVEPTSGWRFLQTTPASGSVSGFRKGVGIAAEYDDTTLAALASYLLTEDI